eukprot:402427-Pelagomonas_calceolata.AAC.5
MAQDIAAQRAWRKSFMRGGGSAGLLMPYTQQRLYQAADGKKYTSAKFNMQSGWKRTGRDAGRQVVEGQCLPASGLVTVRCLTARQRIGEQEN